MVETKARKILEAASRVFLRYGFKRVSMNEIAEAAGISRPALYLVFNSKEEVFNGVLREEQARSLAEIREGLADRRSPEEKLLHAFEVWTVRAFDLIRTSPEAREIHECGFAFARKTYEQGLKDFEDILASILAPMASMSADKARSPEKIARVLTGAVLGFKQTAKDSSDLRSLIREMLALALGPFLPARSGARADGSADG